MQALHRGAGKRATAGAECHLVDLGAGQRQASGQPSLCRSNYQRESATGRANGASCAGPGWDKLRVVHASSV